MLALHDEDDEFLPAQRTSYRSTAGAGGITITNSLPPIPPDFKLEYSDRPLDYRAGLPAYSIEYAAPPGSRGGGGQQEEDAVSEASSFDERALCFTSCSSAAEAVAAALSRQHSSGTAAAGGVEGAGPPPAAAGTGFPSASRRECALPAMAANDDMFSISKRPSGSGRPSSSSGGGGGGGGAGTSLANWSHPGVSRHSSSSSAGR
jgi:hypothetical protein